MRPVKTILFLFTTMIAINLYSQSSPVDVSNTSGNNMMFIAMATLASVLLLVIFVLSSVLKAAIKTKIAERLKNKNKLTLITVFVLAANKAVAQTTTGKTSLFEDVPIAGMHPLGFYALMAVIFVELFVILWLCLIVLKLLVKQKEKVKITKQEKSKSNVFSRFISRKLLGVKPVESDKDVMLDHEYDGIRELDNDLPPWWKYGFYLTILSGIIYFISYHVTHTSLSSAEEYELEMKQAEASVKAYRTKMAMDVDESNAVFVTATNQIELGKVIYQKNCAVCHGNEGQGVVGPNFADNHWIYGNKPGDLFGIVKKGTAKGMKGWKDELSPIDIQNVISFIHTFKDSKPSNPKDPEGTLYEDEMTDLNLNNDTSRNAESQL